MSDPKEPGPGRFRVLDTIIVNVSAKHCLWFTWAEDGFRGPYGEEGEDYFPRFAVIRLEYQFVNIRVTNPEAIWWHGSKPIEKSTADGRSDQEGVKGLGNKAYKNDPQYHSSNIEPLTTNLNKLVALVGTDTGPIFPFEQIPVGLGLNGVPIPYPDPAEPTPRNLYFGMHDAFQWNNNGGEEMVVEVELLLKDE